ncbi:hypothetical protein L4D20_12830 [Vibrio kyushuensis]|uniref:hypothetical protein n=1 Tax=Vibrio TaxID=662 RepID=UPI003D0C3C4C
MAAQPLTKGRFVQIIITLSVLVGAFTWRTINHSQVQLVDCENQISCTFNVKNIALEAIFTQDLLKIEVNSSNIDISTMLEPIHLHEQATEWKLPEEKESDVISLEITLENNDVHHVNLINYP